MSNIMITRRCNLSCPYCFANSFVGAEAGGDISMDAFQQILEFVLRDGACHELGLIGGEPACHRHFGEILKLLAAEEQLDQVTLYTNGTLLEEYLPLLQQEKFKALINCNEPGHMGSHWARLTETLKQLRDNEWRRHVTLGVNFYSPEFDYRYMLDLTDLFAPDTLRVSVSVPNQKTYAYDPLSYFERMKPGIFTFFKELMRRGVTPFFDCNVFPACLISTKEIQQFEPWGLRNPFLQLKNHPTGCRPVIDIMDDMTAVRCFGLSEDTRVSILDFASLTDLKQYYLRTVDAYAVNTHYDKKCADCYQYRTMRCSGGCLVYKIEQIRAARELVEGHDGADRQ